MSRKINLILMFVCLFTAGKSQKADPVLQSKIEQIMKDFHGKTGILVRNLAESTEIGINADSVFPTASMIKVSILTGIMNRINKGELQYHQELIYRDSLLYPGVDLLGSFKDGEKIELSKLMMLMLTMSDNTASLWLQSLAGGGIVINQLLDSMGFKSTRVNSRTAGREEARNRFGWGQTSPREMVRLFEWIYSGKILTVNNSERMLRLLGRDYWDEEGISQVPPWVFVACKNGAVDESRSETMLVMAPHGPYIFCLSTKDQQDTSWRPDNEGWVLARKISRLLWNYYEPGSKWIPAMNVDGIIEEKTNKNISIDK